MVTICDVTTICGGVSNFSYKLKCVYEKHVCLGRPYHFKFFKGCLPQILLGPFLNTLTQMIFKMGFTCMRIQVFSGIIYHVNAELWVLKISEDLNIDSESWISFASIGSNRIKKMLKMSMVSNLVVTAVERSCI